MISLKDAKSDVLRRYGVLYRRPHDVTDPLFHASPFFDPRDLVQVKYELLRRVQVEGLTVPTAATSFGFSRSAFYQAVRAYQRSGFTGLVPQRRGPRRAHKLSGPVIDFVLQHQAHQPALPPARLCPLIQEAFGLSVHPRVSSAALARRQKRGPSIAPQTVPFMRIGVVNPGPNAMKTCADRP